MSRSEAETMDLPPGALDTWEAFIEHPEPVTDTVQRLTGHPAASFAVWARDHAPDLQTER
jgi:hypothetical protein